VPLLALVLAGVAGAATLVPSLKFYPEDRPVSEYPPTAGSGPSAEPEGTLVVTDALAAPGAWAPSDDAVHRAACRFDADMLIAERTAGTGTYRCPGPTDTVAADQRVEVDVRLLTPGSCAGIWLRFDGRQGYLVQVCAGSVIVSAHTSAEPAEIRTVPGPGMSVGAGSGPNKVRLTLAGDALTVRVNGETVVDALSLPPAGIAGGAVVLGIFTEDPHPDHRPPYRVGYQNVRVWALGD
jgi:hypothetical protein